VQQQQASAQHSIPAWQHSAAAAQHAAFWAQHSIPFSQQAGLVVATQHALPWEQQARLLVQQSAALANRKLTDSTNPVKSPVNIESSRKMSMVSNPAQKTATAGRQQRLLHQEDWPEAQINSARRTGGYEGVGKAEGRQSCFDQGRRNSQKVRCR
jgi:hypothetical protein